MNDDKIEFYNSLRKAADLLERAAMSLKQLWDDGSCRLRAQELKEVNELLNKIHQPLTEINPYLDKFKKISNGNETPQETTHQ